MDCPLQAKERYSILTALCSLALTLERKMCLPVETAPLDTAETSQSLCLHHNKSQLSNIIVLNKLFLSGTKDLGNMKAVEVYTVFEFSPYLLPNRSSSLCLLYRDKVTPT